MAIDTDPPFATDVFDLDELQLMIEQVWDPIIAINAEGAIQYFNAAAEDMFGYSADDILSENVHELLAPEKYADEIQSGMEAFRTSGEGPILGGTRELDAQKRDGTIFPIELTVNAYEMDDDLYAVGVVRDISDRKALEEEVRTQRDWAEQYFDLSGTIMVELGTDGTIKRINDRGRRLLGYDKEELVGKDWFRHVAADSSLDVDAILSKFEEQQTGIEVHENTVLTRDGDIRIIKWHNTLLRDSNGTVSSILSSGSDITERRRQEEQLLKQNERLDEFASVVSHDLRNPLNVAQGRATLLAESVESPHLDPLLSALTRIENIIKDTLVLARNGEVVSDFQPIQLSDIVGQSWGMVDTKNATLSINGTLTLHGDSDRLKHLFENLFRNAVEHGGDDVTITVGCLDSGGFYIEDTGPGIPPENRETIFEPGVTSRREGTGFGLAIVRRVVDAHGWSIQVTDGQTGGARFEIRTSKNQPTAIRKNT